MDHIKQISTMLACVGLLCLSGCLGSSSDIATVSGTITVDGEPIEQAIVSFKPVSGRASVGLTDANGFYTLGYVRNQKGALIGEHRVTVQTDIPRQAQYGEDDKASGPEPRKEMLPRKYHDLKETELTAKVEPGSNTINFDLSTKK